MSEKRNSQQSLALRCAAVFAAGILAVASRATAEVPQQINHQGVVSVDGERFDGNGLFRFAIVDPDTGINLWSNDGSITDAVGGVPTDAVSLPVTNGVYSVGLGDTSLPNMTDQIAPSVFAGNNAVLRIWFDDGENGNQQLTPDHKLTTVPYSARLPNVFVNDSGNVGIGTTNPAGHLHIVDTTDGSAVVYIETTGAEPLTGASLTFLRSGVAKKSIGLDGINDLGFFQRTGSNDSAANRMFMKMKQANGDTFFGGRVGIGGLPPGGKLHVSSDPAFPQITFDDQATRTWGIGVSATQFVIIDVNTGATHFGIDTSGVVSGTHGVYHPPSDGRLKKDVVTIPNALARVLRLRGINFKWKDSHIKGDSLRIGMIAQEVEKVFPESVHTADDGMKTKAVEYPFLVAALVEAIKELDGIVKQKDAELGAQRRRIGTVESRLAALEARLQKVGQADRRD